MKVEMFTVYDSAAKRYLEPFNAVTIEFAIRQFRSSVETPDHLFAKYPEDYTLFHVGTFDMENGCIDALPTPHNLGVGQQFKNGGE